MHALNYKDPFLLTVSSCYLIMINLDDSEFVISWKAYQKRFLAQTTAHTKAVLPEAMIVMHHLHAMSYQSR